MRCGLTLQSQSDGGFGVFRWPSIYLHTAPFQLRRLVAAAYFAPTLAWLMNCDS